MIEDHGAVGFPFTEERLSEIKSEAEEKKEQALRQLSDLKFLGPLTTFGDPDTELDIIEVARKSEVLALAFMRGMYDEGYYGSPGSYYVLPKLLDAQRKLGKEKMSLIIVNIIHENDPNGFSERLDEKLKDIPVIPKGERSRGVLKSMEAIIEDSKDIPKIMILDVRDESIIKIVVQNASSHIYKEGECAFPWTDQAIQDLEAKRRSLKEKVRTKQKNLEFFAPSDSCHIVDKQGNEVSLETLQLTSVVAVYFSASWHWPYQAFTEELAKLYNKCKEEGKSFEVIFISTDKEETDFDNYYSKMPWFALKYEDRDLKEAISRAFEVEGPQALILLKGDGEMLCNDTHHCQTIVWNQFIDYYPWGPEELQKIDDEIERRKAKKAAEIKENEEKLYSEMVAAGRLPLRRHKGDRRGVEIDVNHFVKFSGFAIVASPSAIVLSGRKAWYEVEFISGGNFCIGWAKKGYKTSDTSESTEGIGQCNESWGFNGLRGHKMFNGSSIKWGTKFYPTGKVTAGQVLGVAADMVDGKILFSLDGSWEEPMGVAFEGLDLELGLFPALEGGFDLEISVNFGDRDMKFSPPDESFEKIHDIIEK